MESAPVAKASASGLGFFGLLTIVLIGLKLAEIISISWGMIIFIACVPWILIVVFLFP